MKRTILSITETCEIGDIKIHLLNQFLDGSDLRPGEGEESPVVVFVDVDVHVDISLAPLTRVGGGTPGDHQQPYKCTGPLKGEDSMRLLHQNIAAVHQPCSLSALEEMLLVKRPLNGVNRWVSPPIEGGSRVELNAPPPPPSALPWQPALSVIHFKESERVERAILSFTVDTTLLTTALLSSQGGSLPSNFATDLAQNPSTKSGPRPPTTRLRHKYIDWNSSVIGTRLFHKCRV